MVTRRGRTGSAAEGSRGVFRGADGFRESEAAQRRAKERREAAQSGTRDPFRVWIPPGETTQLIILDEEPSFFRYEHNMKDPATQKWNRFTGCVSEWDHCPICEATGKEPYYALYLTVIDLTEYTNSQNQRVEFTRKLLVVKSAQHKKFQRILEKCDREGRSMRGALIECTRDGEKDSAIGNDIEFVEFVSEDELLDYTRTYKDSDGKKHTEKCYEVYDYDAIFPEPNAEDLRKLVGADPVPGSRAHNRKELGEEESTRTRPSRKSAVRGRAIDDESDTDSDDVADWDDARDVAKARPRAPSSGGRAGYSRARGRVADSSDDDSLDDDDADSTQAGAASTRRSVRARGRR